MINKMILQGNLVATPEEHETQTGNAMVTFRIAWSETYAERKNELFINCVAFGSTAVFIAKYFEKGSQIIVEGKVTGRSYEDKDGNKRYITDLVVDNCHFSGSKNSNSKNDESPEKKESEKLSKNFFEHVSKIQKDVKLNGTKYEQNTFDEDGDLPF